MLDLEEVVRLTGGQCVQFSKSKKIRRVSIDTRTIKKGDLFVAIKGNNFDGHHFVDKAVEKGAVAVLLSKNIKVPAGIAVICVDNTIKALGQIAELYRRKFNIPVIGITGSTGKTTTKEILSHILGGKYCVLKNKGTENNQIGVPLTILRLKSRHQVLVLELGTNRFGDIEDVAQIARPTIGVLTNIGHSHLQGLNNKRGVFKEKIKLLDYIGKGGSVVYNADDSYLCSINKSKLNLRKLGYGLTESCQIKGSQIRMIGNIAQELTVGRTQYKIKTPAYHNIYNVLAAISVAKELKVNNEIICDRLKSFKFCLGRFEVKNVKGVCIIDDSYNANPLSFSSAIHTLNEFKAKGKKILVCGDMMELGKKAGNFHADIARQVLHTDIDAVLTLGALSKNISALLNKNNVRNKSYHFPSHKALNSYLKQIVCAGDVILVKGSRSMQMEKTVDYLLSHLSKFKRD